MMRTLRFCVLPVLAVFVLAGGATARPDQRPVLRIAVAGGNGQVNAHGLACHSRCSLRFPRGRIVRLTATSAPYYEFVGWQGACVGVAPSCDVALERSASVRASFEALSVPLELSVGGPGKIATDYKFSPDYPPFECNRVGDSCRAFLRTGSKITLTAVPDDSGRFAAWDGPCASAGTGPCTLRMDAPTGVSAAFAHSSPEPGRPTLTVQANGQTRSEPAGIDCPGTCSASFPSGTLVTLINTSDYTWGEACFGWYLDRCLLVVDETMNVYFGSPPGGPPPGVFGQLQVTVSGPGLIRSIKGHPIYCGSVPAAQLVCSEEVSDYKPQMRSLRPRARPGARFVRWGGLCRRARGTCTLRLTSERPTYPVTALFRRR